ncbi:cuticle protein 16.5-like [Pectinophora gossypiella]|uniref:cuticle protein 16.5-like n=1 Tax=Pectinophora gossypiella TaxID=13191 RepID=UPI00214F293C|nr:cuticle protein 16.5-like [Pectinophora gossypiella]
MMKLVVLCLVLAAVRAEPGALLAAPLVAPLTYSAAVVAPATTSISQQSSSVVHPSPYYYNAGYFPHFIKKRSVSFALPTAYSTPYSPLGYPWQLPYAAPIAALPATPVVAHAPLAYTHLIKKRSAPLLASAAYIAPATSYSHQSRVDVSHSAPLITSYATPLVYSSPFGYSHFIKKRSAPLLATVAYVAPAATSYQTRADVRLSGPLITSYAAPIAYTSPLAYTHVY